jgi:hypothetical protein
MVGSRETLLLHALCTVIGATFLAGANLISVSDTMQI